MFTANLLVFASLAFDPLARAQVPAVSPPCTQDGSQTPQLSRATIQTGRLPTGGSTCVAVVLQRGEFARIAITADVAYLRARLLGSHHEPLQVTWIWSFFPSLPLTIEAPESATYVVELSVPQGVSAAHPVAYRVQMTHWESAIERSAGHQDLRQDPRVAVLRSEAQRIRTIAPEDTDYADLEGLREALRGVRVVLLGEGDHGGGADLRAQTRITRFLHERMGFDVVVFESNIYSADVAWRALQSTTDPQDAFLKGIFGIWGNATQVQPLVQYLAAQARAERPLELAGFDCQFTGTAAPAMLEDLQQFLRRQGVSSLLLEDRVATRVLSDLISGKIADRTTLPSVAEQTQTVDALRATVRQLERQTPSRDAEFWAQALRSTAVQFDLALNALRGAPEREYAYGRERQIVENLNWLIGTRYSGRKVVVWAHTAHAMRSPMATGTGRDRGYTLGQGLWERIGNEAFAIGFTSYKGKTHWVTLADDIDQDVIPDQDSLFEFETMMDATGLEFGFVNLRAARAGGSWLGGRFVASPLYLMPEDAEWSSALDGLFFIRTQEPRRRAR